MEKFFFYSRLFGEHAQDAHAHAVNGTHPHSGGIGDAADAFLHLVRRLIGEGDREHGGGRHAQILHEMRDARRKHAGLSAPRARQNQNRPFRRENGLYLFVVETVEYFCPIHEIIIAHRPRFCKFFRCLYTKEP